ncbi:MAG TPA: hypothetical protein VNW30_05040 [Opitutaceae bacterium]|nr:hypothetical protein [Opitutaceae bacterium]
MALLKIRNSEKVAVSLVPSWHPNFRNFEQLPDVKAVRTSFFVNCAAIVITSVLLLYFGLQEYKLHDIHVQISDWQRQIDDNRKPSEQAVELYQKFQNEEKKAAEVAAFVKTDFVRSDFIIELGQSLPKNITLDSIDVHQGGVSLHGIVRGTSDEASGQAQTYINQLRADPQLIAKFEAITMPGLNRGSKDGQLEFEIFLKSKDGEKP